HGRIRGAVALRRAEGADEPGGVGHAHLVGVLVDEEHVVGAVHHQVGGERLPAEVVVRDGQLGYAVGRARRGLGRVEEAQLMGLLLGEPDPALAVHGDALRARAQGPGQRPRGEEGGLAGDLEGVDGGRLKRIGRVGDDADYLVGRLGRGPQGAVLGHGQAGRTHTVLHDARGMTLIPAPAGVAVAGSMRATALPSTSDTHTMPLASIWTSWGCRGATVGTRVWLPPGSGKVVIVEVPSSEAGVTRATA